LLHIVGDAAGARALFEDTRQRQDGGDGYGDEAVTTTARE
jgi:hypothetical protein